MHFMNVSPGMVQTHMTKMLTSTCRQVCGSEVECRWWGKGYLCVAQDAKQPQDCHQVFILEYECLHHTHTCDDNRGRF